MDNEFVARAKYDFTASEPNQLSFKERDTLMISVATGTEWWFGYALTNPQVKGWIPYTYVTRVEQCDLCECNFVTQRSLEEHQKGSGCGSANDLSDFLKSFSFQKYIPEFEKHALDLEMLLKIPDDQLIPELGNEIRMDKGDFAIFAKHLKKKKEQISLVATEDKGELDKKTRAKWLKDLQKCVLVSPDKMIEEARQAVTKLSPSDLCEQLEYNDQLFIGILMYEQEHYTEQLPNVGKRSVGWYISFLFDSRGRSWESRIEEIYNSNRSFWKEWKTSDNIKYYVNEDTKETLWDTELAEKKKQMGDLIVTNEFPEEYEAKRIDQWKMFGQNWECLNCKKKHVPFFHETMPNCQLTRIELIADRMSIIPHNAAFVIRGLRHLYDDSLKKTPPISEDTIRSVLLVMEKHSNDPQINIIACLVLRNFACGENKKILQPTIPAIVGCMTTHLSVADVQEKACEALRNITTDDKNEKEAVNEYAIQRVLMAMKQHEDSPSVQEKALMALFNLTYDDLHKTIAIECNAIEYLNNAKKQYSQIETLNELISTVKHHLYPHHEILRHCTKTAPDSSASKTIYADKDAVG